MSTEKDTQTVTNTGEITRVTGPLVRARGMSEAKLYEVVQVSADRLLGEVIELHGDEAAIQVYEETAGIGPGDPVYRTGRTMSVALAPGLLESIYDGVQRPLKLINRHLILVSLNVELMLTQWICQNSGRLSRW